MVLDMFARNGLKPPLVRVAFMVGEKLIEPLRVQQAPIGLNLVEGVTRRKVFRDGSFSGPRLWRTTAERDAERERDENARPSGQRPGS